MTNMRRRFWKKEEAPEFFEGQEYNDHDLELMADALLRADGKRETCRKCGGVGERTGESKLMPQYARDDEGEITGPMTDARGRQLIVAFDELSCKESHTWYEGEGKAKGFKGDNQILFEEHIIARKRREIFCENGVPDPGIVSGLYNRTHKDGRRVNSEESRKKHGASFYS